MDTKVRSPENDPFYAENLQRQLGNIKDPAIIYKERLAYQKKKYDELLQKISFLDTHLRQEDRRYDYPEDFRPFVFFFKFLAKRPDMAPNSNMNRLKLWLPDTILTSDGENSAMWFYSSQDGYVHRTDSFTAKNITNKLGSFSSPDELVAVLKKPQARDFAYVGNDLRLLTVKEVNMVAQSIVSNKGDVICLQKYIKSIGPKAFICRTCWRRDRNPYVWVITNNKTFYDENENVSEMQKFVTNPSIMNSCTIVNTIQGRYVDETAPYVANLVKYLEQNIPGARFEEFIADFVKDESGTWWLINVRGFVLVDKLSVNPKAFLAGPEDVDALPEKKSKQKIPEGYQKVAICKYCEQVYTVDELTHKMTLKSIMQTDRHLRHRGKNFKWLERSDITQIDTKALLKEYKVCKSCYKLHQETEKLREVEFEFAKALGIPVNPDKRPDNVSVTGLESNLTLPILAESLQSSVQSTARTDFGSPPVFSPASPTSGVSSPTNKNSNKHMTRYRMMLYLHMLYDVPKDVDTDKNYYIEYNVFGQKQRYKVDFHGAFAVNGGILIPMNKLRMFYLFSFDRKGINDYINEQKVISLNLFCDGEKIGVVNYELQDFLSDKVIKREMFKVFSGKKLPILSWGLKVTVGLAEAGIEDITRIKLAEHRHIYLTAPEYFTCDPLPDEWLQVFEETQNNITTLLNRSEIKSSRYSINGTPRHDSPGRRNTRMSQFRRHSDAKNLSFSKAARQNDSPTEDSNKFGSPFKVLCQDENSISQAPSEQENYDDESTDVIKKILADSIKDFERGDKQYTKNNKKGSISKVTSPGQLSDKQGKSSLKSWSSVGKITNK